MLFNKTGGLLRGSETVTVLRDKSFFARNALEVAAGMIGLELTLDGVGGIIVETEAYLPDDPASHSFKGPTARNASMFAEPATSYVYLIYGMHLCLNAVCLPGSAVLIRALEPTRGLARMHERRGTTDPRQLCSGPAKLSEALGITRAHDRRSLIEAPFALGAGRPQPPLVTGPRIGISRAIDLPWRFGEAGSAYLSRRFNGQQPS